MSNNIVSTPYGFKGEPARLIPSVADTDLEKRGISILLSALSAVHEYQRVMMESLDRRVGARARLKAWTEVVFEDELRSKNKSSSRRPDGAIVLHTGRKTWKALIEAKVNNASLEEEQLSEYLRRAREHGFDAVLTISNDFAAIPDHHPIQVSGQLTRSVKLFHWSWTYLLTQAELLIESDGIEDEDQKYILREVVAYFGHVKSGVKGFTQMNDEWKELVQKSHADVRLVKTSTEVVNTVASWHQEQRELCLKLWPLVRERVEVKLPRSHKRDPKKRLAEDCSALCNDKRLTTEIVVPNAAAPIEITADLTRRDIQCGMSLRAPEDIKSSKARVNWLIRQLPKKPDKDVRDEAIYVCANRPGRSAETVCTVAQLRLDPTEIDSESNASSVPTSFDIWMKSDDGRKFAGKQTFIQEVESLVPDFYESVGQHLRAWMPKAPRVKKSAEIDESDEGELTSDSS
jgi:hypothetical protein